MCTIMASKQKRTVITLENKLQVIAEVRNGKSQRLVVETLGVPKSTGGDIWKERLKKSKHTLSTSSNLSYAKKCCAVLCGTCTFRNSMIFF